jgi:hypothetical protein
MEQSHHKAYIVGTVYLCLLVELVEPPWSENMKKLGLGAFLKQRQRDVPGYVEV